jgi:hypothetical protein
MVRSTMSSSTSVIVKRTAFAGSPASVKSMPTGTSKRAFTRMRSSSTAGFAPNGS